MEISPKADTERTRIIYERLNIPGRPREKTTVELYAGDPFRVVMSGMLSARTREEATLKAMQNLFALADTPETMKDLAYEQVLKAISPVMYPEPKANYVLGICKMLSENGGVVPKTVEELEEFPGVGWKVAVLTLWLAYGLAPEICVDVHVARIGIRLGLVKPTTKDPQKVSRELMPKIPKDIWGPWNPAMVIHGRTTCYPTHPACSRCPVKDLCPKIGV